MDFARGNTNKSKDGKGTTGEVDLKGQACKCRRNGDEKDGVKNWEPLLFWGGKPIGFGFSAHSTFCIRHS